MKNFKERRRGTTETGASALAIGFLATLFASGEFRSSPMQNLSHRTWSGESGASHQEKQECQVTKTEAALKVLYDLNIQWLEKPYGIEFLLMNLCKSGEDCPGVVVGSPENPMKNIYLNGNTQTLELRIDAIPRHGTAQTFLISKHEAGVKTQEEELTTNK